MMTPIVSVIMPVYNGEKYIEKAVHSVYAQKIALELIVVNDGSTDGTAAILEQFAGRDDFTLINNSSNLGAAGSRNVGVQKASGRYVAFLDADDWWEPGKLAEQIAAMEREQVCLSSTGRALVDDEGKDTGRYIGVKSTITYKELLKHNQINCSSVVLTREAALEFPMEYEDSHEDYITWLRILKKYKRAVGIDKPYLNYRLSPKGKSRNKWKSASMTYKVYRYVGYGRIRSGIFFLSYAVHGVLKYYINRK